MHLLAAVSLLAGCATTTFYGGGKLSLSFLGSDGGPSGELDIAGASSEQVHSVRDGDSVVCSEGVACAYGKFASAGDDFTVHGWMPVEGEAPLLDGPRCGGDVTGIRFAFLDRGDSFDVSILWELPVSVESISASSTGIRFDTNDEFSSASFTAAFDWHDGCGGYSLEPDALDGMTVAWSFDEQESVEGAPAE